MIKNWEKFNENLWSDFVEKWEKENPDKIPTVRDLPFKVGDLTNRGRIRMIDNPYREKSGKLSDILIGVDGDYGRFTSASEIELVKPEKIEGSSDEILVAVDDLKDEINFNTIHSLDIRACKIIDAERIPKRDRLIKLTIDGGFDEKTVVTNLGSKYDISDFKNKTMWFVLNLKPVKISGVVSEAMILAATTDGESKLIETDLPVGSKLL